MSVVLDPVVAGVLLVFVFGLDAGGEGEEDRGDDAAECWGMVQHANTLLSTFIFGEVGVGIKENMGWRGYPVTEWYRDLLGASLICGRWANGRSFICNWYKWFWVCEFRVEFG